MVNERGKGCRGLIRWKEEGGGKEKEGGRNGWPPWSDSPQIDVDMRLLLPCLRYQTYSR